MNIIELKDRQDIVNDIKINNAYNQFGELIKALRKKTLPDNVVELINEDIKGLNDTLSFGNELKKAIKQKQAKIIKLLAKELKIVTKNYYRNLWLVLGMSSIGIPIGVAFGISMGNIGLLGIGFPIGMAIGMLIGSSMDKKAATEGRQLDLEIKY